MALSPAERGKAARSAAGMIGEEIGGGRKLPGESGRALAVSASEIARRIWSRPHERPEGSTYRDYLTVVNQTVRAMQEAARMRDAPQFRARVRDIPVDPTAAYQTDRIRYRVLLTIRYGDLTSEQRVVSVTNDTPMTGQEIEEYVRSQYQYVRDTGSRTDRSGQALPTDAHLTVYVMQAGRRD